MAQSALRVIRTGAFEWTALEELVTPASLREICAEAFNGCKRLRTVRLNEGLEMLGTDVEMFSGRKRCGVFQGSGLERIWVPRTLQVIGKATFRNCVSLSEIHAAGSSANVLAGHVDQRVQVISGGDE